MGSATSTARLEARISPELHAMLKRAAELEGRTMTDFVVETRTRKPIDVLPGERVTHGAMAIIYGAFLAHLIPEMAEWWFAPTGLPVNVIHTSRWLKALLAVMGVGVALSGIRDACAALGVPGAMFPWRETDPR